MNELIKTIKKDDGTIPVSGRELHDFLEVGKDFSNWFKDMASYGFEEGKDFSPFSAKTPNGGRPRIEYVMTLDMAKEISMIQRNEKGKQARQYFIEVEKRYKQAQIDMTNLSPETRMAEEGVTKSKRDKTTKVDVIGNDKKLIEIYMAVVKDFAIKYSIWKEEY